MIICFSGTGNSRLVALELQRHLGGEVTLLEGELLLHPSRTVLEVPQGEDVIWVFPVYSWGVPPVVARFIRRCKIKGAHECRHFMVCTCGDDVGRADDRWRNLVGRRGWSPRGAFSVTMPNTYVCMKGFDTDSPEVEKRKLAAMPESVAEISGKIRKGFAGNDVIRGSFAWLKTAVVYPFFKATCMSPRPFHVTDSCISCGLCARECPMENITMKNGRPEWGNDCALCLRCYHRCPSRAIAYGKETDGKGQYQAPDSLP